MSGSSSAEFSSRSLSPASLWVREDHSELGKVEGRRAGSAGEVGGWRGGISGLPGAEGRRAGPGGSASSGEKGTAGTGWRGLLSAQSRGGSLTARMTSDGEFSDFVIDKDKNAVGNGAEPPGEPVGSKRGSAGPGPEPPRTGGPQCVLSPRVEPPVGRSEPAGGGAGHKLSDQ